MKSVLLFSDGSCLGNPGPGGWAFILQYGKHELKRSGGEIGTTNNQMELRAVIEGVKALKEPCKIELYTDSSYVANAINSWLATWQKRNFKNVKNIPLWHEFLQISRGHEIAAYWVKGHSGHPQNEECDKMAKQEALNLKENDV